MAVTHATAADSSFTPTGAARWNASHTVGDGSFVAAKLSATATDVLFGRSTAGAGNGEEVTCTAAGRALIDDASASAQRTTLGLGTIATQAASNVSITGGSITGITDLAVADGGTGASDAGTARTNLGLGSISTQASNSVSITGGSITGTTGVGYCIQSFTSGNSPADATTYYQGAVALAQSTTAGTFTLRFPIAGTVIAIQLDVGVGGTLGSTEQSTVSFRLNNTTDTAISTTVQCNAANQSYLKTGISIAVTTSDYAQIKWVTPTWTTNPTAVILAVTIFVQT